jgi:hypothetical protein
MSFYWQANLTEVRALVLEDQVCLKCERVRPCLECDGSENEYASVTLCKSCILGLFQEADLEEPCDSDDQDSNTEDDD